MSIPKFKNPACPNCGKKTKKTHTKDGHIIWWCKSCETGYDPIPYDEDEDNDEWDESISASDAALIWMSNGRDEDYQFGYTEEELKKALK